jgi:HK97 family phage major capsid protein
MKQSIQFKALRSKKIDTLDSMVSTCELEGRSFTDDESKSVDNLNADIAELDGKIERAEKTESNITRMAHTGAEPAKDKEVESVKKSFSLSRAIAGAMSGSLNGAEAEAYQEAQREARQAGLTLAGNVAIPSSMFRANESRALGDAGLLSAGTGEGSDFVPTEHQGFIEALQPRLLIEELGATVISGVSGNLDMPRISAAGTAGWGATEAAATPNSELATDKLSLTPKRVGAYTTYTKQLLTQGSPAVDRIIADDLGRAIRNAVDSAAFNGAGSSGVPEGIFNTSGVQDTAATNGTTLTAAELIELITNVAAQDGLTGGEVFALAPAVYAKIATLAQVTDVSATMVNDTIAGYKVYMSSHLNQGVTKGSSTSNTGQVLFGNFANLLVARWTGVDLLIDQYTLGGTSEVKVIANQWMDVGVRHPKAFATISDAIHG